MSADGAAAFFDRIAGRYERSYGLSAEESRRRMDRVLAELPPAPARVLDLGVGTGRELTALLDAGYEPTGIDVSREMLERCARRARAVPLIHRDFYEPLPFPSAWFDAAVALHGSLAHPPDASATARLASHLARVVRPAGVWLAEMPTPAWLDAVEAGRTADGSPDRRVWRTGPETCWYEDEVLGVSIEARLPSEAAWRAAFGALWTARFVPVSDVEWIVVARRA
ncbi:MAG TPA: class I SAM-dependent methyltransferase [Polyangiaceae bacterium]|jgi:SAM-dependent methyltransferase